MQQVLESCLFRQIKEGSYLPPGIVCERCGIRSGEIGKDPYGILRITQTAEQPCAERICTKRILFSEVLPCVFRIEIFHFQEDRPYRVIEGSKQAPC